MNATQFQNLSDFQDAQHAGYRLLPFRFGRIPSIAGEVLLTSESGEVIFIGERNFQDFVSHRLTPGSDLYRDLRARHFLYDSEGDPHLEVVAAQYRTRKSFLRGGPSLYLFVVTLRCDHACLYCQVSRQGIEKTGYDLSLEDARHAVDRLFDTPSPTLTVEFQGGEPLLAFDKIRYVVDLIQERNLLEKRHIQFTAVSTLHFLTDSMLNYFREHSFTLSTSLDGPEWLHNANRPNRDHESFLRTIEGIAKARYALGGDRVAALTTLTKTSLPHPEAIIDTYLEQGFRSVFLRPLSPYGFAVRTEQTIGYTEDEYLRFYERALTYLIRLNRNGQTIDEAYTTILLNHILTPFPTGYVDLRSPTGAVFGALVYNYDGRVYASDEARMLVEMGDHSFCLGHVGQSYQELISSEAAQLILASGIAESLPGCSDCVYLPYCGADPVYALARQGDPVGHRPTSGFCKKQTGMFEILFSLLHKKDPDVLRVFLAWITYRNPKSIVHPGFCG